MLSLLLLAGGCQRRCSTPDDAAIKANYSQLRNALLEENISKAVQFVSDDYLTRHPPEQVLFSFRSILAADRALTQAAWTEYEKSARTKAWLFPAESPTVGYMFVLQTNGWKITGDILPVVD